MEEKNSSTAQNTEKQLQLHMEKEGRRERLRRLRLEIGGKVCIPDTWDHESSLQDWFNCTAFTVAYVPPGLASARESLAKDARQSRTLLRVESRSRSC